MNVSFARKVEVWIQEEYDIPKAKINDFVEEVKAKHYPYSFEENFKEQQTCFETESNLGDWEIYLDNNSTPNYYYYV